MHGTDTPPFTHTQLTKACALVLPPLLPRCLCCRLLSRQLLRCCHCCCLLPCLLLLPESLLVVCVNIPRGHLYSREGCNCVMCVMV